MDTSVQKEAADKVMSPQSVEAKISKFGCVELEKK